MRSNAEPVQLVRSELAERAQALGLDISGLPEKSAEAAIRDAERACFLAENDASIDLCNAVIEEHGLLGDHSRLF